MIGRTRVLRIRPAGGCRSWANHTVVGLLPTVGLAVKTMVHNMVAMEVVLRTTIRPGLIKTMAKREGKRASRFKR